MSISDDLQSTLDDAYKNSTKENIPKEWLPYTESVGDQIGSAVVRLPRPGATEHDLLVGAGFDPTSWIIAGDIATRKWMTYDGRWLYHYKFSVRAGESEEQVKLHVDDLVKMVRKRGAKRPAYPSPWPTSNDAFAFLMSDLQLGKTESGVGTPQITERYLETVEMAVTRIEELRKIGRAMPHGSIIGMGDIVEGCSGNYSNQPFLVDLNDRDQNKLARELITHTIDRLSPMFETFSVASVGGNHGENRQDGKKIADDADNRDVSCFEAVKEVFDRVGQEIDWTIPQGELSIMLELGGVNVAFAHGHTFRKGSTPAMKAIEWWKGQDFGYGAVREAKILCTGHFHHYLNTQSGRRTHIQTPAMDPGSKWYSDSTGEQGLPGVVTMRFDSSLEMGYDDLKILVPTLL